MDEENKASQKEQKRSQKQWPRGRAPKRLVKVRNLARNKLFLMPREMTILNSIPVLAYGFLVITWVATYSYKEQVLSESLLYI